MRGPARVWPFRPQILAGGSARSKPHKPFPCKFGCEMEWSRQARLPGTRVCVDVNEAVAASKQADELNFGTTNERLVTVEGIYIKYFHMHIWIHDYHWGYPIGGSRSHGNYIDLPLNREIARTRSWLFLYPWNDVLGPRYVLALKFVC